MRSFVTTPDGPALLTITDESEVDAADRLGGVCISCRNPVVSGRTESRGAVLLDGDLWCWTCFFEVQQAELEPPSHALEDGDVASVRLTGRKARSGRSVTSDR